jgi:site-specific DNA recombinase
MAKALIYTRVSKDRKQSRSTAEQEAECRAVADREGWEIVDVLSDNGRSASRYAKKDRPAWEEVKRRLSNGVDVLVTWEASRSNRDLGEFVALRDLCRTYGVLLNYSGHTIDFDDSSDSFRAGLDALISEDESERTAGRIRRTVRANAVAGRPHGRRLYGYRYVYDPDTGALKGQVPDDAEAEIVREIARRFLSGESRRAISDDLNARGVRDRSWSETRVKRILLNPGYIGKRVHKGEVVGDADWEPILDQATFDAIGERLVHPGARGGHDLRHLLSGIVRCGRCGGRMYCGKAGGKLTYECRPGRGHLTRNQQHLDAYVTTVLLERLATINLDDLGAEHPDAIEARADAAEMRGRINDAADKFAAGEISSSTLAKIETNLAPKIRAAEKRARTAAVPPNISDLAGEGIDRRWDTLSVEQRREIVRLLLDVTVLPDTRPRGSRGFDPDAVKLEWRV